MDRAKVKTRAKATAKARVKVSSTALEVVDSVGCLGASLVVDITARRQTRITDTPLQARVVRTLVPHPVLSINRQVNTASSTVNTAHQAMDRQHLDNTTSKAIMIHTVPHSSRTNSLRTAHRLHLDNMVSNLMASHPMVKDHLHSSTDMDSSHPMIHTDSIARRRHMISMDNMGRNRARTIQTHHRINTGNNLHPVVSVSRVVKHHHLGMASRASNIPLLHLVVNILRHLVDSILHHLAVDNMVRPLAVLDSNRLNNILVVRAILVKDILGSPNMDSMGNRVVDMVDSRVDRRSQAGKCGINE
jgi:hypothetical protein